MRNGEPLVAKRRRTERVSSTSEVSSEGVPSIFSRASRSSRSEREETTEKGSLSAPTTRPRDGCSLTHTSPHTLFDPMVNDADCLRTLSDEADYHADHRSHGWLRRWTNLIACWSSTAV